MLQSVDLNRNNGHKVPRSSRQSGGPRAPKRPRDTDQKAPSVRARGLWHAAKSLGGSVNGSSHFFVQGAEIDVFRFATFCVYFALVLLQLILSCFAERPPLFSKAVHVPVSNDS